MTEPMGGDEIREALSVLTVYSDGEFARPERSVAIIIARLPQLLARLELLEQVAKDAVALIGHYDAADFVAPKWATGADYNALRKSLAAAEVAHG